MLEEKDLRAIAQLMKGMEDRIDQKLAQQKKEIMQEVGVLIENEVTPRFNLLAEELDAIKERLPAPDILEQIQEELDIQHAVVKRHTKEIQALKKAQ
nr:MAG TPA: hypothetical protein [Caudoviricetes sp.]